MRSRFPQNRKSCLNGSLFLGSVSQSNHTRVDQYHMLWENCCAVLVPDFVLIGSPYSGDTKPMHRARNPDCCLGNLGQLFICFIFLNTFISTNPQFRPFVLKTMATETLLRKQPVEWVRGCMIKNTGSNLVLRIHGNTQRSTNITQLADNNVGIILSFICEYLPLSKVSI